MNTLGILYSDDFTRAVYPQVGKTLVYTQMLSIRARDAGRFLQVKRQALLQNCSNTASPSLSSFIESSLFSLVVSPNFISFTSFTSLRVPSFLCLVPILSCSNPILYLPHTTLPLLSSKMTSRGKANRSAWDADPRNKRILEDKWGSDSEYDPRRPRNRHPQNQPKPSHFGPNFQNIEKNRSESFTNRIEPKMPKPYAPRPTDWSEDPRIKRDYSKYKARISECDVAQAEYGALNPRGVGRNTEPAMREPILRDGLIANTERRTAANK